MDVDLVLSRLSTRISTSQHQAVKQASIHTLCIVQRGMHSPPRTTNSRAATGGNVWQLAEQKAMMQGGAGKP